MAIAELNHQLLQLLREYRDAALWREAYKTVLLGHGHEISPLSIQAALDAVTQQSAPRFEKAEAELLGGEDPRTVLNEFLHPEE